MTEERKNELVAGLVRFAQNGRHVRKIFVIAAIGLLLLYYHYIGKRIAARWEKIYGR